MEFSNGTSAPSASPERTASMAWVTVASGSKVASAATGRVRNAAWANVPAGPRKAMRGPAGPASPELFDSAWVPARPGSNRLVPTAAKSIRSGRRSRQDATESGRLAGRDDLDRPGIAPRQRGVDGALLVNRELGLAHAVGDTLGVEPGLGAAAHRRDGHPVPVVVEQSQREGE